MRKRWIAVVGLVGIWWWQRGGDEPVHPHRPQAAVLGDGFALLAGKQVVELDRAGNKQHEMTLKLDREVRFVGSRAGSTVGYLDGKKFKLAVLDSDGNTDSTSTWGKNVKELCYGRATNEYRFGVGFLEADGKIWFVHGPMDRMAADTIQAFEVPAVKPQWCAIASAEQNIALLWREGSRILMNFCTKKQCSSLVVKVPIRVEDRMLAFGCVQDSCLFATRDKHGTTTLHRVTEKGRAITRALEHARPDSPVSIVGAGTRAFAIAYVATDNNVAVQRVAVDGTFTNVWHFSGEPAPSLAWANGKLLVATPSRSAWVLDMPR